MYSAKAIFEQTYDTSNVRPLGMMNTVLRSEKTLNYANDVLVPEFKGGKVLTVTFRTMDEFKKSNCKVEVDLTMLISVKDEKGGYIGGIYIGNDTTYISVLVFADKNRKINSISVEAYNTEEDMLNRRNPTPTKVLRWVVE